MERWQLRGTRAVAARAGQDTAEIDEAIAERERELTRAGSRDERMRALASRLGLSAADVDLLWWVVAAATEPAVLRTAEPLGGTRARRGGSLAMFAEVVELPADEVSALGARLACGHPLVVAGLEASAPAAAPRSRGDRGDLPRQPLLGLARLDGLHRDELGEIAGDLDLAGEERLDPGGDIGVDEDAPGQRRAQGQRRRDPGLVAAREQAVLHEQVDLVGGALDGDVDLDGLHRGRDLEIAGGGHQRVDLGEPGVREEVMGHGRPYPACPRAGLPLAAWYFFAMSKPIPAVLQYMSTSPHSIGRDQTLATAHKLMRAHTIRHLPVLDGGKLVGMLTVRDLHLIETLRDVDPEEVTVEEAMSTTVYAVSPEAPLDGVAEEMATHKYGSAVVMQHDKVVGIFTTVDACRALAELLRARATK